MAHYGVILLFHGPSGDPATRTGSNRWSNNRKFPGNAGHNGGRSALSARSLSAVMQRIPRWRLATWSGTPIGHTAGTGCLMRIGMTFRSGRNT
jgi:hypothetical protein